MSDGKIWTGTRKPTSPLISPPRYDTLPYQTRETGGFTSHHSVPFTHRTTTVTHRFAPPPRSPSAEIDYFTYTITAQTG